MRPFKIRKWYSLIWSCAITCATGHLRAQVLHTGAMRDVMWKGMLDATVTTDSLVTKAHCYGLGPIDHLKGEILVWDSESYRSEIKSDSNRVSKGESGAPFFVYAYVKNWKEISLPDSVSNLLKLEHYLTAALPHENPSVFKLEGLVESASYHVVNLAPGTVVHNPEEAHKGQMNFDITHAQVRVLGFYSEHHQAIFTHHSTFIHVHVMSDDKKQMGHMEKMQFNPKMIRLFVGEDMP